MVGSKKQREWRFEAAMNKTEISNPKFSSINCIGTQTNPTSNNTI